MFDGCGAPSGRPVRFTLTAEDQPCLLSRVAQVLARRGLTPEEWRAVSSQGRMEISVRCACLAPQDWISVEKSLRQLIGLQRLEVTLLNRKRIKTLGGAAAAAAAAARGNPVPSPEDLVAAPVT